MSASVFLPQSGMGISEATILKWFKNVGDVVAKDEVIAEIETAKSVVEVEAPVAGRLSKIHFAVDETVEVGTEIAIIDEQ